MMIHDKDTKKRRFTRTGKLTIALTACLAAAGMLSVANGRNASDRLARSLQQTTQAEAVEPATLPRKVELTTEPVAAVPDATAPDTGRAIEEFSSILDEVQRDAQEEAQAVFDNAAEPLDAATEAVQTTQEEVTLAYVLPLGTDIIKDYSMGVPVYSATMEDWRTHNGVDFAGAAGAEVRAAAGGTVTAVYEDIAWGGVVEMAHADGVSARYCGLAADAFAVAVGDILQAGDSIGVIGIVPVEADDGAHIHVEFRVNGSITDPLEAMGRGGDE